MQSKVVGIDIGGANLKAAIWKDEQAVQAAAVNFPMWQKHRELATATLGLLRQLGVDPESPFDLAVTMTGELADCFQSRTSGVREILAQLSQVCSADRIFVYAVDGQWLSVPQAMADPWSVAASNWHALGSWLAKWSVTRQVCQNALIVDIGSTTVDIIPTLDGQVATTARTDRERLERGQLIYTGLSRTPVCAVVQQLRLRDREIPVMAELFATVDDAWLVLGEATEDAADNATADGRPRTLVNAQARLARMIGEDRERLSQDELRSLAEQVVDRQVLQIVSAVLRNRLPDFNKQEKEYLIYSGHGLSLWLRIARTMPESIAQCALTSYLDMDVSRCAPAAAVAWLLADHFSLPPKPPHP